MRPSTATRRSCCALEAEWAISGKLAAPAPEQFWRLAPPPAGWEGLAGADLDRVWVGTRGP